MKSTARLEFIASGARGNVACSVNAVAKLMRQDESRSRARRRFGFKTNDGRHNQPAAERSFSALKRGPTHHDNRAGHPAAPRSLFDDVEIFSNRRRRHSTLDDLPPAEFGKHFH